MTSIPLILQAYIQLMAHDVFMSRHNFASLHRRVKGFARRDLTRTNSTETVSSALDIACCFYPKRVLCLQRSSVLVRMLRLNGVKAQMIIGAQKMPFKAHAWVEVDGHIINDRLASRENFLVLEVC